MKTTGVAWLVLLAMITGCGGGQSASSGASHSTGTAGDEEQRSEIVSMLAQWGSAFSNLDLEETAQFYSPSADFRWYEEGEVRYRSQAEVLASLQGLAGVQSLQFRLIEPEIEILNQNRASLETLFAQSMDFGGGEPFQMQGTITAILERRDDGWLFSRGHTSTVRAQDGGEYAGQED